MKGYITLLSNSSYLPGVQVLARSLKAVESFYPLICVLSVDIDEQTETCLTEEGISCIRLSCSAIEEPVNPQGQSRSHWNYTFDKLQIWGLTQFEKVVFLDSDMLIVRNIDALFDCKPFSAVTADSLYPGNEAWAGGLNSGLMVIEPDKNVEKDLLNLVAPVVDEARKKNISVGDQDVIKRYLLGWAHDKSLHLDEGYNLFADHLTYYVRHLGYALDGSGGKPVYVVHFVGKAKPWMRKNLKMYVWFIKMCIVNPLYLHVYRRYLVYMKQH